MDTQGAPTNRGRDHFPEATSYPTAPAQWLTDDDPDVVVAHRRPDGRPRTVVAVGHPQAAASLCVTLGELGHDVRHSEDASFSLPDSSVDAVVVVHRLPSDLHEIARVLRPGGRLSLVVNERDRRIPWVRKLDRILAPEENIPDHEAPTRALVRSGLFGFVEDTSFRFWESVNRTRLTALLAGLPEIFDLSDDQVRAERIDRALALYDDYGRGNDGMQLPWVSRCYRATVLDGPTKPTSTQAESAERGGRDRPSDGDAPERPDAHPTGSADSTPGPTGGPTGGPATGEARDPEETGGIRVVVESQGQVTDVLLIDFR
ncbi:hypothetical protein [Nocardioides pacificus]